MDAKKRKRAPSTSDKPSGASKGSAKERPAKKPRPSSDGAKPGSKKPADARPQSAKGKAPFAKGGKGAGSSKGPSQGSTKGHAKGSAPGNGAQGAKKFSKKPFVKGGKNFKGSPKGENGDKPEKKLLTRQDRKEMKKERKRAKPNADIVEKANKVYSVKLKDLSKAEREQKVSELLEAAKGKIAEISTKHDMARVLQLLIKHGNAEQRASIFTELKGTFQMLAAHHYGHFLVLKFLQYGKEEQKGIIQEELVSRLRKLALHADAAKVVDYMYASARPSVQARLLAEFYGPEYAVFLEQLSLGLVKPAVAAGTLLNESKEAKAGKKGKAKQAVDEDGDGDVDMAPSSASADEGFLLKKAGRVPTLGAVFAAAPEKREPILRSVEEYIGKLIDKQMLMFRYVHSLLAEFFKFAPAKRVLAMVVSLAGSMQALHHSTPGARVASLCLLYASNKERKAMLKTLKGNALPYAQHPDAFAVVLRALDVVDDTVLLDKNVVADLAAGLNEEFLTNPHAAKVVLHLLSPLNPTYLAKHEVELMTIADDVPEAKDDDEEVLRNTSKKAPEQRRTEILAKFLPALLTAIERHAAALLRSPTGSKILFETLREASARAAVAESGSTFDLSESLTSAVATLAALVNEPPVEGVSVLEHPLAHLVFKRLLQSLEGSSRSALAKAVFEQLGDAVVRTALTNRGAFVLAALLEAAEPEVREEVLAALEPQRNKLAKLKSAGSGILVKLLDGEESGAGSGKASKKVAAPAGKAGVKAKASAKKPAKKSTKA